MKRELGLMLSVVVLAVVVAATLHVSGFCFSQFHYLDDRRLIETAVTWRARYIDEIATRSDEPTAKAVQDFLAKHPDCCAVVANTGFADRALDFLSGSRWVQVQYKKRKQDLERSSADGAFYVAFIEISPCGQVGRSIGSTEKHISASSFSN